MNLPIMDESEHRSVPKETTTVSSTTADRVNQLLALSDPESGIEHAAPSVAAVYNAKSAPLLKDGDVWGSWHVNGDALVIEVLKPPGGIRVHCDYKEAPHGGIRSNGQIIFPSGTVGDGVSWEWNGHQLLLMQRCPVPCAHCKSETKYFLFMDGEEVNSKRPLHLFWWRTYLRVFLIGILLPLPFVLTLVALVVVFAIQTSIPPYTVLVGIPFLLCLGLYWVVRGVMGMVRHGKELSPRRFPVCWLSG